MKLHTLAIALTVSVPLAAAYVGEMTYYTPSSNSCGITAAGTEDVVALSSAMMANGANPNANVKVSVVLVCMGKGGRAHADELYVV